ncbi:class I adenylate-forming enzyme family protein [Pseudomonas lopnurensis]|uniref:class I adenylate-forming enzyme family protein n=1 Tax=Pseudomonas lopnurensis TaxID=1477517 RepID=UPI0028B11380|nr:long-chain-fatty-acid--CoA ligase [Pseudomonas lopnurensis]
MQLTQPLHKAARERPEASACVFHGRRSTFAELRERVARLAAGLRLLGVRPEDRVAMLALNSDRYLEYLYACFWAGAVINPVNVRWSAAEIAYSLNDCTTGVLIVDDLFFPLVEQLQALSPGLRHIVHCGEEAAASGLLTWHELLDRPALEDCRRSGSDLAAVLYTGGTTGAPKGVKLSHANLMSNALSALAAAPRPEVERVLHVAPLFHVGGLAAVFQTSLRGACHVLLSQFDTPEVLSTIEQERVGEIFLVPTMLRRLLDDPAFAAHDLSSLSNVLYGAAPINAELLGRALVALPTSQFMQVYGMTELAPVAAVLPASRHSAEGIRRGRLASAGHPAPLCEIRIVDDQGRELPPGVTGEIVARGPGVMLGYWNKPEETTAALREGWLHTGDAGHLDSDGYLHVTDRIKDMIISGGENVYSSEVEQAILAHPEVQLCAVIGIPDKQWGEAVHALVVLRPGSALSVEQLLQHCRERIAGYKCPRRIELRDELPLSAAGKLLKYQLREPYWHDHARRI